MWKNNGKALMYLFAALIMTGLTTYREVASDGVTASEWVTVTIGLAGALNVWLTANVPAFSKAKTLVGAVFLVLSLLQTYITGGISADEWSLLLIQFLGAVGVVAAPSTSRLAYSPSDTAPARY